MPYYSSEHNFSRLHMQVNHTIRSRNHPAPRVVSICRYAPLYPNIVRVVNTHAYHSIVLRCHQRISTAPLFIAPLCVRHLRLHDTFHIARTRRFYAAPSSQNNPTNHAHLPAHDSHLTKYLHHIDSAATQFYQHTHTTPSTCIDPQAASAKHSD